MVIPAESVGHDDFIGVTDLSAEVVVDTDIVWSLLRHVLIPTQRVSFSVLQQQEQRKHMSPRPFQ